MRFHWKIWLLHFLAASLCILAFRQLFFLFKPALIPLFELLDRSAAPGQSGPMRRMMGPLVTFRLWNLLASWLGIGLAFALSFLAARRQGIHWLHSIGIFLLCLIAYQLQVYTHNGWLLRIAYWPGSLVKSFGIIYPFLLNGCLLLTLSLLLFFLHTQRKT